MSWKAHIPDRVGLSVGVIKVKSVTEVSLRSGVDFIMIEFERGSECFVSKR